MSGPLRAIVQRRVEPRGQVEYIGRAMFILACGHAVFRDGLGTAYYWVQKRAQCEECKQEGRSDD